jgi:hypothetical protein
MCTGYITLGLPLRPFVARLRAAVSTLIRHALVEENMNTRRNSLDAEPRCSRFLTTSGILIILCTCFLQYAQASTYVAYIPLDDPVYTELNTLNGLGLLYTYLPEIRPISRIEAARLTLEAERILHKQGDSFEQPLAVSLINDLRAELSPEIGWLENNQEDNLPTMAHPVERLQLQYIYSHGTLRRWQTSQVGTPQEAYINAKEVTPLLPNNDGLPTASGSNEVASLYGWFGVGGFLTGYADGALAGPLTHNLSGIGRLQPISAAAVASYGNLALSFGMEQTWWGVGYFNSLSQGNNASPFPALRLQNIHPTLLPWFFRYLGQFRHQFVFAQLDDYRYYWHPYLFGQNFLFKPLPTFEFGVDHMIMFAGRHNNNYGLTGFLGRATGFATGNAADGNTHSRGGLYFRKYFPSLRNSQLYFETMGNDNLAYEVPVIGHALPFLSVSYLAGIYVPYLTRDGLTDLRLEVEYTDVNEEQHGDSLYWTYEGQLMGTSLGPDATEVDVEIGRWVTLHNKLSLDLFYTQQAPNYGDIGSGHHPKTYPFEYYPYALGSEHSGGFSVDLFQLPRRLPLFGWNPLGGADIRGGAEYVRDLNYEAGSSSVRFMISVTGYLMPDLLKWDMGSIK